MMFVEAAGMRMPAIGLGTWELRGADCVRLVQEARKGSGFEVKAWFEDPELPYALVVCRAAG